ncbi:MAG TPA: Ig-like domain-containing protein, partial [Nannocystis sp.]
MQRASLRRVGRLWAVIAAVGGVSGCGDDLPANTTEGSGSSSTGTDGDTDGPAVTITTPTVTTDEPGTATGPDTSDGSTTVDPPTTGDDSTTTDGPTTTTPGETTDGINEAPVALVDVYLAKARQVLAPSAAAGVLANDFDPDGDKVEVIASDPLTPGGASVTMPKDGSFTYFPPADLWGPDSFTYKIHDGKALFASTTVQVKLSPTAIPLWAIAGGKRGFAINGAAPDDYSGRAVQSIGDLNNDGLGDLVVASRNFSGNTGRVYVVFGKTTGGEVSLASLADDEAGFEITGEAAGDLAGSSISGAGDVNGDGIPDILLGAPGAGVKGKSSGTSYVVLGKASSDPVFLEAVALGEGGFSIDGEATQHFSGESVKAAGDVNGDGLADIIVGAYGA